MATITGIAVGSDSFNILVNTLLYLDSELGAGLVATLDDPNADLTVFAPTDAAFGQLAADLGYTGDVADETAVTTFLVDNVDAATLLAVVTYHVAEGSLTSTDIIAAGTVTTLQGGTITADIPTLIDNEPDLIDPSLDLTQIDIPADNGIVHVIDRVLLPIDLPGNDAASITGIVAASGGTFDTDAADFDILLNAVLTAGLETTLDSDTLDATVFAPTDQAFIDLAVALGYSSTDEEGAWGYLVEALTLLGGGDPIPLLTTILQYHVLGESFQASQVLNGAQLTTLLGTDLQLDGTSLVDADPDIPDPSLVATDIQASNGVVHVIDGVLIPANLLLSDGSNAVDFVIGEDASETFRTGKDNDFVSAQGGDDIIATADGDDIVLGGSGDNRVNLGLGDDFYLGGEGNERIAGNVGNDVIDAGNGNNTVTGDTGNDVITTGSGDDLIRGGQGNDTVNAGDGNDVISGNRDDDLIFAGGGNDRVVAGSGNDTVNGGAGDDYIILGAGEDIFIFEDGAGAETIRDFNAAEDQIDLTSWGVDFAAIEGLITNENYGSLLTVGDDSIRFFGIDKEELVESVFIFGDPLIVA